MVLESTFVCVDNSDYMRNGDFIPTRLQAQQDAVNLVCHSKTRSNPENNVGLLTMANTEVLVTLTSDSGKILARLHQVQPKGTILFIPAIRIAHLALKHRQNKNQKMRIVTFVGSPIPEDEKDLIKVAKKLKKEKVNVDVVNFGEEQENTDKLTAFINTINGKDGTSSHLVTVPPGPMLSDALVSSPIIVGEDGSGAVPGGMAGFDFGIDPNEDPELALALRVSMEEQRARQEDEARKVVTDTPAEGAATPAAQDNTEEALLRRALEMSMQVEGEDTPSQPPSSAAQSAPIPDFSAMTEEEQIAYAMQMSLNPSAEPGVDTPSPMDTDDLDPAAGADDDNASNDQDEDYSEMVNDPEFLQSVLEGLPGVDPQSDAIRSAMGQLTQSKGNAPKDKDKDKDEGKKDDKK